MERPEAAKAERHDAPLPGANFNAVIERIAREAREGGKEFKPDIQQDGGEIHPALHGKGVTFNFYLSKGGQECAVNYNGGGGDAPGWLSHLTGVVFTDFTAAKGWLRGEAERYASQETGK